MNELSIVPKGAVLIRNETIVDIGPARRVENLAGARRAREIDASGRVVMPAFIDADVGLVTPAEAEEDPIAIHLMSKKRVLYRAAAMAAECARYGCLAVGAHTRCATDLPNIRKLLRTHQALQLKPLRIRSIFSPEFPAAGDQNSLQMLQTLTEQWLPAVRGKKLASVVELTVARPDPKFDTGMLREVAHVAAGLGFAIRLRSPCSLEPIHLQLALSAGALGIIAPLDRFQGFIGPLSAVGCIRVIPASEGFDNADDAAAAIRAALDGGAAIAISSSYRLQGSSSLNMQYLLHLAVHELGLTAEEAITATTWNPACSLRLSRVTGSLEPGKSADLLMMEASDYRDLPRRAGHHDISMVMRAGKIVLRVDAPNID